MNVNFKNKKLFNDEEPPLINVGSGEEIKISSLCKLVCKIMGFNGKIIFNKNFPDGTPRKLLNCDKLKKLIKFKNKTSLYEGLKITIKKFNQLNQ